MSIYNVLLGDLSEDCSKLAILKITSYYLLISSLKEAIKGFPIVGVDTALLNI